MFKTANDIPQHARDGVRRVLLALADDKFLLGHHNGEWTGLGPFLEADIAFSNIAQDEVAHAQELFKLVAALDGAADVVAEANQLAYGRPANERLNAMIVEPEDEFDWALAVARQCFFDHADRHRLAALQASAFLPVAELAGKMMQEVSFHIEHFDGWMTRLGQAGGEAAERVHRAVDRLWPVAGGLFAPVEGQDALATDGILTVAARELADAWRADITALCQRASIAVPTAKLSLSDAGRQGQHDAALAVLLAEVSEVFQLEPGAEW